MKKLLSKDKKLRLNTKSSEIEALALKSISQNSNFFQLIRWNASHKFKRKLKKNSRVSTVNYCISTINKKRLNKHTLYSRHIFLKLIRSGVVAGIQKSSW